MAPYVIEYHPYTSEHTPGERVLAALADGPRRLIAGIGSTREQAHMSLAAACVRALKDDEAPPSPERMPADLRADFDAALQASPPGLRTAIERRARESQRVSRWAP